MEIAYQTIDRKLCSVFFLNLGAPTFSCQNYRNMIRFIISYFNSVIYYAITSDEKQCCKLSKIEPIKRKHILPLISEVIRNKLTPTVT